MSLQGGTKHRPAPPAERGERSNLTIMIRSLWVAALLLCFSLSLPSPAFLEKIEGLEYNIRKINDAPLEKFIVKNFDLYELYFENKIEKIYSIPGYSIDLGIDYLTLADVNALYQTKFSKKSTVFNIAAGAASVALGGFVKSATTTALRTIGSIRHKNKNLSGENSFLSPYKTYIVYPGDGLSLFFFVDKLSFQAPNSIRFICHDEENNVNQIIINNNFKYLEYSVNENENTDKNLISDPGLNTYK